MDSIASGRVPVELKKQGGKKLEAMGATVTDLINAAYEYLVATGSLPSVTGDEPAKTRSLTREQADSFLNYFARSTVQAPSSWEGKTYDQLRFEAMQERYGKDLLPDSVS